MTIKICMNIKKKIVEALKYLVYFEVALDVCSILAC
jgi:hypothetical protein